jgi:hypothetical protein
MAKVATRFRGVEATLCVIDYNKIANICLVW